MWSRGGEVILTNPIIILITLDKCKLFLRNSGHVFFFIPRPSLYHLIPVLDQLRPIFTISCHFLTEAIFGLPQAFFNNSDHFLTDSEIFFFIDSGHFWQTQGIFTQFDSFFEEFRLYSTIFALLITNIRGNLSYFPVGPSLLGWFYNSKFFYLH